MNNHAIDFFLENIWLHLKDPMIRIVYPRKWNRENYALDLESEFYRTYKIQMTSSKIKYTDFGIYMARINEPELECDKNTTTIIDPRCYIEEIYTRNKVITEIEELCKILKQQPIE